METSLQTWDYLVPEVRTIEINSEPWFVLADVCKALEISNSRNVANRLEPFEKGVHLVDTLGWGREMNGIIFRSPIPWGGSRRKTGARRKA